MEWNLEFRKYTEHGFLSIQCELNKSRMTIVDRSGWKSLREDVRNVVHLSRLLFWNMEN